MNNAGSTIVRFGITPQCRCAPKPGRDVPPAVQHPPDVDVIRPLDGEDQVRVARQRPTAQRRQVQFVGIPQRTGGGVSGQVGVGVFQCIDEPQGRWSGCLAHVVRDGRLNVVIGLRPGDDGLWLHRGSPAASTPWTRCRKPAK